MKGQLPDGKGFVMQWSVKGELHEGKGSVMRWSVSYLREHVRLCHGL